MLCPTCKANGHEREMVQLFISQACDYCDGLKKEPTPTNGFDWVIAKVKAGLEVRGECQANQKKFEVTIKLTHEGYVFTYPTNQCVVTQEHFARMTLGAIIAKYAPTFS